MQSGDWWGQHLTAIARNFQGIAGLIMHDFSRLRGTVLDASEGVSEELLAKYERISRAHPWGTYFWADPVGSHILAERRQVRHRIAQDRNFDAFVETLLTHNIVQGIGAILWKDRRVEPRWVVAIGILKPSSLDDSQVFSEAEQNDFVALIPGLVKVVRHHRFVVERGSSDG